MVASSIEIVGLANHSKNLIKCTGTTTTTFQTWLWYFEENFISYFCILPFVLSIQKREKQTNKQTIQSFPTEIALPISNSLSISFMSNFRYFLRSQFLRLVKKKDNKQTKKKHWKLSLTKFITLLSHCPKFLSYWPWKKRKKTCPPWNVTIITYL